MRVAELLAEGPPSFPTWQYLLTYGDCPVRKTSNSGAKGRHKGALPLGGERGLSRAAQLLKPDNGARNAPRILFLAIAGDDQGQRAFIDGVDHIGGTFA